MCHPVRCRSCSKVTWAGCGLHVDEALAGFAPADLCDCGGDGPAGQPSVFARFLNR
ncbi:hypothetical protein [Nocardioides bigeumensis]|jgi:hypothetical protein|uniref:hypothetical protein n=1 Tax=Nocardioides bigeumensis TaxID=433657 RepID=UPI0031D8D72D